MDNISKGGPRVVTDMWQVEGIRTVINSVTYFRDGPKDRPMCGVTKLHAYDCFAMVCNFSFFCWLLQMKLTDLTARGTMSAFFVQRPTLLGIKRVVLLRRRCPSGIHRYSHVALSPSTAFCIIPTPHQVNHLRFPSDFYLSEDLNSRSESLTVLPLLEEQCCQNRRKTFKYFGNNTTNYKFGDLSPLGEKYRFKGVLIILSKRDEKWKVQTPKTGISLGWPHAHNK